MSNKIKKELTVALLGNPNSGKTSLFNALVGTHLKVGNWPGVTIEKYQGYLNFQGYRLNFVDLPGTYSLTPYSPEEVITRNFIIDKHPDVVIDVLDGTNLERNLYLTTQIMELEQNMLVALNIYDEVKKQNITIDFDQLELLLGSHVIPVSSVTKEGLSSLLEHILSVYTNKVTIKKNKLSFREKIEERIGILSNLLKTDAALTERYQVRWLAIKLLENDQQIYELVRTRALWLKIEPELARFIKEDKRQEEDAAQHIAEDRYAFVHGALQETVKFNKIKRKTVTELIDTVILHRFLGVPIFILIMWSIFQFTFRLGEVPMLWLDHLFKLLGIGLGNILPAGFWRSLLVDGIIAGVGGVLVFLPNVLLLFLAIAFLEGTGYMARSAFVVDKLLHKVGLHGKSFIPMLTGFGCSVPALLACRTLKNPADRLTTMLIIPFMSCGAKLPVYILLAGAFFPPALAGNVLFGIYLFGIFVAILSAKLFKSTVFKGESEPFVMELPPYRLPGVGSLFFQTWTRAYLYLKKAGTIILLAAVVIWLASQPINPPTGKNIIPIEYSVAGQLGKIIEPVIKPLGFNWKIGVALISGVAAKEVVVSTLGTIYSLQSSSPHNADLRQRLHDDPSLSVPSGLALLVFVLLYIPCIAATAVFHKEAGSWRWTRIYVFYTLGTAWLLSFLVYNLAKLFIPG